jgi:hypothetical protein
MVVARNRSGTECIDLKPNSSAPARNLGHLGGHDIEIGNRHRLARRVALDARAVPGSELQDFDESASLIGRCDNLEVVVTSGGQNDSNGGGFENARAILNERVQKVDDVIADNQCVCQSDEGLHQLTFTCLGHHVLILRPAQF